MTHLAPVAMFALVVIIVLAGGATLDAATDAPQATPTPTPTYQECPCWRPGDPDNTCVCPKPEPETYNIYLPMMEVKR